MQKRNQASLARKKQRILQVPFALERLETRDLLANCAGITDIVEYPEFEELPVAAISCLSDGQLSSIPDKDWFARLPADSRTALSAEQIRALPVSQVGIQGLSEEQLAELTTEQVRSLDQSQYRFLLPQQIPLLTGSQIASIESDWWYRQMSEESRAAITGDQVPSLNLLEVSLKRLTEQQLDSLSPEQVQSLGVSEFHYLRAHQVPWLSAEQITSISSDWYFQQLSPNARLALTAEQIQRLRVSEVGLRSLSSDQVEQLSVEQIQSLQLTDYRYLHAHQIPRLTSSQVQAISSDWWFTRLSTEAREAMTEQQIQALDIARVGTRSLSDSQVALLKPQQISSLTYREFSRLGPAQVVHLTPSQLRSIPNNWWFTRISTETRAALNANQVRSLDINRLGILGLTEQQVSFLGADPLASVTFHEFHELPPAQIPLLTAAQIATIPDHWWFARWSEEAHEMLGPEQIRALRVDAVGIRELQPHQVNALSTSQVQQLSLEQFRYLTAEKVTELTPSQISSIPTHWWFTRFPESVRARLTPVQTQALNVAQIGIGKLTSSQIGFLSPSQVRSLPQTEFRYLTAEQAVWLTPEQLAGIDKLMWFTNMSESARASLQPEQIRALDVSLVTIDLLATDQVEHLSAEQITALAYPKFRYLNGDQITKLSAAQISSIPDTWWFTRWSEDNRAQLTDEQVRSLDTANISLGGLTPGQRQLLTVEQIRSLPAAEIQYLSPEQVTHLTAEQVAGVESRWQWTKIPGDVRAAFNREQLLSLNEEVTASIFGVAADFVVTESEHQSHVAELHALSPELSQTVGSEDPHQDPEKLCEHTAAMDLLPESEATVRSVQDGNWSDPNTWAEQIVPGPGAKVLIESGHVIRLDAIIKTDDALDILRIDGRLEFASSVDTQLAVDTILVAPQGQLSIGSSQRPIADHVAARVVFVADGGIDATWDPHQLSRGLLAHGQVEMYGKEVTPYVALGSDPLAGASELVLASVPTNWEVGDRLVLTGTHYDYSNNQDEELEILAIRGNVVDVDADPELPGQQPLAYNHVTPDGDDGANPADPMNLSPDGDLLNVYVANVSRNVVLISETPEINEQRGHVMFMHNQDVDIKNVGFYGLGRTDKRNPINDPRLDADGKLIENTGLNPQGRYSVHFHRAGTSYDNQPGWVSGSAIVDSPGWGLVNHESYVHAHNNVAFQVTGASFVTEFGNEIGSFEGNLSINNAGSGDGLEDRSELFDFAHGGHGFWVQGPLVELNNNVAAGSREAAFVVFTQSHKVRIMADQLSDPSQAGGLDSVPVGSVPLKSFVNNTAFASRRGLETWFHQTHMNDGQSFIDDFVAWNINREGIATPYTARTTIRNATLVGNLEHPRGIAIGRNQVTNQMTYEDVTAVGFDTGILVPVSRDTTVQGGRFAAINAIRIDRANDSLREVDILGAPQFETLSDSALQGRTQYDVFMNGGFQMDHFDLETLFTPDVTRLGTLRFNNHQLFYHEQAAEFVPFRTDVAPSFVPRELIDLTNTEILDRFGLALAGAIAHADAQPAERINGLVGAPVEHPESLTLQSDKYTSQMDAYELVYLDTNGDRISETISLDAGWNLLTREIDGLRNTFVVFADDVGPEFQLRGNPTISPDALELGLTIQADIFDNSNGRRPFKREFTNLESLPVLEIDGQRFLEVSFQIEDLAGNTTPVVIHVLLDPTAPFVPGTGQEDLPPRLIPITLYELLQFYIIA